MLMYYGNHSTDSIIELSRISHPRKILSPSILHSFLSLHLLTPTNEPNHLHPFLPPNQSPTPNSSHQGQEEKKNPPTASAEQRAIAH